jgi:hypothetical protein
MEKRNAFTQEEIKAFEPAEKVGLVASINPDGLPHVSLITSIGAADPATVTLGEFCRGRSKQYIQKNPQIAFLIMTLDRKMWRGKARWTHLKKSGPEFERYNNLPMFRYNTYFGINTVHYLQLVETQGPEELPMGKIVRAALMTKWAKGAVKTGAVDRILKPFAENLFNQMDSLKFIAYMGNDGFPIIVPVIQCQAADSRRLVFSPLAFKEEIIGIEPDTDVAVFGLTMKMEDVLIRGVFKGYSRKRLMKVGTVDIDWVYNSMPPAHDQIYPEVPLAAVRQF